MKIHGLHHIAFRCQDSEETRKFYEDFLGLPLAEALKITQTKTGNKVDVLHTFFKLEDGSFIAFFEAAHLSFEFKQQHDFDLHLALEASSERCAELRDKALLENREVRGPVDHGVGYSTYFRDPNGYIVELVNKKPEHDDILDPIKNNARQKLDDWQQEKTSK
ncbi:MAG: VOC family protein [Lentisphaeraceae bacterium]|nr:VOC family protein [Lentisphaeraceae bacterium]